MRPGERYAREMRALFNQDDDADQQHDRDLREDGYGDCGGREADAPHGQPDRCACQNECHWLPGRMP